MKTVSLIDVILNAQILDEDPINIGEIVMMCPSNFCFYHHETQSDCPKECEGYDYDNGKCEICFNLPAKEFKYEP